MAKSNMQDHSVPGFTAAHAITPTDRRLSNNLVPVGACDSHIHIFDRRFPEVFLSDDVLSGLATVDGYRAVQRHVGTARVVIVTPRNYDTDNAVTLDAIRQLGIENARGVAVLRPDVSDSELEALHAGGIRGIRFTLYSPLNAPTRFEMIKPLACRVHTFGWHVQLHLTAEQLLAHEALLSQLPTSIVIDHLGRIPPRAGTNHPACKAIERLLDNGRAWIKLSAPYLDSATGPDGGFFDLDAIAGHWVSIAPERLVWGSDWPHTSLKVKPDAVDLLSKLSSWVDDAATLQKILVTNPAQLYGFG